VAAAIFKPVVVGTVARVTDESNSSTGFGVFYMMVNVGGFVGPIIAGVVRGMSWDYVFIACSCWAALNLVIVLLFYKEPTTEAGSAEARTFRKVLDNAVEVLGNLRFFITVLFILLALMLAGFDKPWFSWARCGYVCAGWLALNLLYDVLLRAAATGKKRNPLLTPMVCSNWRFALFLLIMSGFWTSFNQIFITMPEYIRDFVDTKPMVNIGRTVFNSLGKEEWINGLAAIEQNELLAEFDGLVRRSRDVQPMLKNGAKETESTARDDALRQVFIERNLTPAELAKLNRFVGQINVPGAENPVTANDIIDGAKTILQYKVRIQAHELAELISRIPDTVDEVTDGTLAVAVKTVNKKLSSVGKPVFDNGQPLRDALRGLITTHGPMVPAEAVQEACSTLSTGERAVVPAELALGVRDVAYRPYIWQRMDQGRQVNPEHIVNFDAGAIIILQVLISFLMARFHRFTTMIVGMLVAAIGIGLSALAGGTAIGPIGGLLIVVIAGIIIFAIGEMMASPTSQEYVGRIAPRDKVALYMGYYFVAIALGNLFGGLISGGFYGWLARDMQRPDIMWLAFGGLMLFTAVIFVLYNLFVLPRHASDTLTPDQG
jgi:dipeptide/tripeptide permease